MADFTKRTIADMATDRADINIGTTGSMHEINWGTQDAYWRENFHRRPYVAQDRGYDFYQPAYRYGCDSAFIYAHRPWDDTVEADLARGWAAARGESAATWEQAGPAVRDAYERSCGKAPEP